MSELISRKQAIETLCREGCGFDRKECKVGTCYAVEIIEDVPSVQPTHQTPSNVLNSLDCVDRAEAIKAVKFYETFCDPYPRVIEALEELPSVQPRKGKWRIVSPESYRVRAYRCSECNELIYGKTNYCPNCGARMDMRGEEE